MRIHSLAILVFALVGCSTSEKAGDEEPIAPATLGNSEWLKHGNTDSERRFSPLSSINKENVARLGLAWSYDTGQTRKHEATPLVSDGIAYFTSSWSNVHAVDAKTGEEVWRYDPEVDRAYAQLACCGVVNRGVALWKDALFLGALDGRLIKLNKVTGQVVWEKLTVDQSLAYTITGAPRVIGDKIIIGNGGAEYNARGYVTAYDARDGSEIWRFWTVPGNPTEPFEHDELEWAAKTWNGEWWKLGGGGTVWDSMAYDDSLGFLYVGTGNGTPWSRDTRSPGGGDNLFLSSILALDINTGKLVWHYQTTPADNWDYTATQHIILADLEIDGETRQVVMQAPKNGFFYVIDRATGELLSAEKFAPVTWASHVDMKTGRPVEADFADYIDDPVFIIPGPGGAHNWQPMSFNERNGLVYIPAQTGGMVYRIELEFDHAQRSWNTGTTLRTEDFALFQSAPPRKDAVLAWDPVAGKEVWQMPLPARTSHGGLLSTAGGLVFQGDTNGDFKTFDADSGELLWSTNTQVGLIAPPVTYEIDGIQYVLIVGGSTNQGPKLKGKQSQGRAFAFAIDHSEAIPEVPERNKESNPMPEPFGSDEMISDGMSLFFRYCGVCHGGGAVSPGDAIPDLRYSSQSVFDSWESIVLKGAYKPLGMPSFEGTLTVEQVDAIKSFVAFRSQSRE